MTQNLNLDCKDVFEIGSQGYVCLIILSTLTDPFTEMIKAVLNFMQEKQILIQRDQSVIIDSKGNSKNKYLVVKNSDGTTQIIDLRNYTTKMWELLRLHKKRVR